MKTLITVSKTEFKHTYTSQVYFDGTVYRWSTNDSVPPADAIREYGIDKLPGYDANAHELIRDDEMVKALEGYRQYREKNGYSREDLFEMRAAFGPGTEIVDVVTGKKIKI